MSNSLDFKKHIEINVRPKLKSDQEKAKYAWMATAFSTLGVDAYSLSPKEIIANLDHKEYEDYDKFNESEWLDFISHPIISKYLENEILKLNSVSLRQKLVRVSQADNLSQADVKVIGILKDIVDEARDSQENSVITFSSFYPPRYRPDNEPNFPEVQQNELRNLISYLGIESDYMESIDKKTFLEKEAVKKEKIASVKNTMTTAQKIAAAKAQKKKLETKFDKLKMSSLDEVK